MNTLLKIFAFSALLCLSASGNAQQPGGGKGTHDMGAMDPAKMTEHLKQKQEHMLSMHDLSNKILAEQDPQKQQALKDQQLELMKAHHMDMMSMHHDKPMDHKKMH
ncbi:hypothetical protein NP590_16215 [Methylomonas sp. SURF-2]|uniref:DUF305 domain-containing protein n=1 Tax=Methylomonas subterranea TaxID=2952225 RepID=A0ABT1TJM3_9GAMM|nr:hypothetical protein [Methylomonas sp. SURF-2]MCQ8105658.1 hypothetical protein [Methylomonas sp. SURF-2]